MIEMNLIHPLMTCYSLYLNEWKRAGGSDKSSGIAACGWADDTVIAVTICVVASPVPQSACLQQLSTFRPLFAFL
jgi:hypothetical protein